MGSISVMSKKGDEKTVEWNPEDEASVKKAKAEYDDLKKKGYEFFEVEDAKGKRVKRWSKKLGKVIATPGVATKSQRTSGQTGSRMSGGPNASMVR